MISNESSATRRAVFFDRDGIVNRRRVDDYVKTWEEFAFLPEIFEVLPRVRAAGYATILVTNQRGIARGLMSEAALDAIHSAMQGELARHGVAFDAIYHCPHERDAGCACRKPLPGMLLDAAREHAIDLASSWMIGDAESDIIAGRAAGCRTILVAAQSTAVESVAGAATVVGSAADHIAGSLLEAWTIIAAGDAARSEGG